ncbi:MAG: 2-aminoethylphosphonate--pyruvate transaminase [Acidaminococcales bacterium]|jgi:2-aminoethylphosphonate-pyruvate transaminase|nr:2-aminoethylphosphonate--pyruvate transaminase [Acidaminococcales bacterium]
MNTYKLLTPGPLTTTETVKAQMLVDRCTWDDDYKSITQKIRRELLALGKVKEGEYTSVLMQGSGSFGVEATLTCAIGKDDKCLFVINGEYGRRMVTIAQYAGLNHSVYSAAFDEIPSGAAVKGHLEKDGGITHIAMVHCETTTGILNPLDEVAAIAKQYGKILIVDAMSSFGGIPINIGALGVDFLISSANKCIQGVPGFSFIIARTGAIEKCKGVARSLSLDIYDQWAAMRKDGKWRFTSPTHVVAAFARALDELETEGGIKARHERYKANNALLRKNMKNMGFTAYLDEKIQSPIITTFVFPAPDFNFPAFYEYVKSRGFVLYPGKLTEVDTFRIGNIGEIYKDDIEKLCAAIKDYMEGKHK